MSVALRDPEDSRLTLADDSALSHNESIRLRDENDTLRQRLRTIQKAELMERDRAEESMRKASALQSEMSNLSSQLREVSSLHEKRNESLQAADRRIMELTATISEMNGANRVLEEEIGNMHRKVESLVKELDARKASELAAKDAESELNSKCHQLQKTIDNQNVSVKSSERKIAALSEEAEGWQKRFTAARTDVVTELEKLSELFYGVLSSNTHQVDPSVMVSEAGSNSTDCADHLAALASMGTSGDHVSFAGTAFSALRVAVSSAAQTILEVRRTKADLDAILREKKSRDVDLNEELKAALSDNATLSARIRKLEVDLSRALSQASTATRDKDHIEGNSDGRLRELAEAAGCSADWASVETELRVLVADRTTMQERLLDFTRRLDEMSQDNERMKRMHALELENAVRSMREDLERSVLQAKQDTRRAIEQERTHVENSNRIKENQLTAYAMRSEQDTADLTELAVLKADQVTELQRKYKDALAYIDELVSKNKSLEQRHEQDIRLNAALKGEKSALEARVQLGNIPGIASRINDTSSLTSGKANNPAGLNITDTDSVRIPRGENKDIVFFLLHVIAGLRSDVKDVLGQRKALWKSLRCASNVLIGLEKQLAFWRFPSTRHETAFAVKGIVFFRRAAIAIIAAHRLMKNAQESKREGRPTRVGGGNVLRLYLPILHGAKAEAGAHLVMPSQYEADPCNAVSALLDQLTPVRQHSTGAARFIPSLCNRLEDGLHRLMSQGVKVGDWDCIGKSIQHRIAVAEVHGSGPAGNASGRRSMSVPTSGLSTPQQQAYNPQSSDFPTAIASTINGMATSIARSTNYDSTKHTPFGHSTSSHAANGAATASPVGGVKSPRGPTLVSRSSSQDSSTSGTPAPAAGLPPRPSPPIPSGKTPGDTRRVSISPPQQFSSNNESMEQSRWHAGQSNSFMSERQPGNQSPPRSFALYETELNRLVADEFSHEVLNVIRALDGRVSSALRHGICGLSENTGPHEVSQLSEQ